MKKNSKISMEPQFSGTAILGERGQVVIPKDARKRLRLNAGDSFLVMAHNHAVILLPKKHMESFIKKLTSKLHL